MSEPDHPSLLFARGCVVGNRSSLRAFSRKVCQEVAGGRAFTCLITSDPELSRLNAIFFGKDVPTDVMSFPASGPPHGWLGEIAISADRAREQAGHYGHSIEEEIRVLMLHGVLHLTGLDHVGDRGRMRRAETHWRKALGLPAGLIERSRRKVRP
jgi:probable rRNA maturation factor